VKLLASLVTLYEVASGLFYSLPESLSFGFADFTLMLKLHVISPRRQNLGSFHRVAVYNEIPKQLLVCFTLLPIFFFRFISTNPWNSLVNLPELNLEILNLENPVHIMFHSVTRT
jgi:hypothetical protein